MYHCKIWNKWEKSLSFESERRWEMGDGKDEQAQCLDLSFIIRQLSFRPLVDLEIHSFKDYVPIKFWGSLRGCISSLNTTPLSKSLSPCFHPWLLQLGFSTVPRTVLSIPKQKITPLLKTSQGFPSLTQQKPTILTVAYEAHNYLPLNPITSLASHPTKFTWLSLPNHPGVFSGPQIFSSGYHFRKMFPLLKYSSPWPSWLKTSFSLGCYSDTFPVRLSPATLLLTLPILLFLL